MGQFDHLAVIIPTLNESESIGGVILDILHHCPGSQILVVDDNSEDDTANVVRAMSKVHPSVQVLDRRAKRGITGSVLTGLDRVDRELVAVIDADYQHPPEDLPKIIAALQDADVAVGVRAEVAEDWPVHRWLVSRGAHLLGSLKLAIQGKRCSDPLSGYFAVKTQIFKNCSRMQRSSFIPHGYKVLFDLLKTLPADARLSEVPFVFGGRRRGQSKLGGRHILAFIRSLVT